MSERKDETSSESAEPVQGEEQTAFPPLPIEPETNELETDDHSVRVIGYVILFVTFGLFGGWAFFAPLDSAALAPGVVTVKGYRKTVQHLEGGIVEDILVRDGENVEKGELLIRLDDTQSRAQLGVIRAQYIAAKAQEARHLAERRGLDKVVYPEELQGSDPRLVEARESEDEVFSANTTAYEGEVSVLRQRQEQLRSQITGLQALIDSKQDRVDSFEEQIEEHRALLSDGYADKMLLRELERNRSMLLGEIAEHQASIARFKTGIGETELEIIQLTKNFQSEVAARMSEVRSKLFDLEERLAAVRDTVRRTEIRAPESGMVFNLAVHTIGGVVRPATPILEIVPQAEELIVEARVSPVDIDRVTPGMTSEIRFSAFKQATTPVIDGRLLSLSADRLVNEQDGMPYYLARVEISEEGASNLERLDLTLLPGMPAEVLINTGSRTFFQYLMAPATNAFARSMIED